VIAPDVMMAEAAAKTVLILGIGAGMDWLEAHDTLAGLLIRGDGRVLHSSRLGGYLWR
jgi:thiamine biosynthesis lipoprotein ApbE